MSHTRSLLISLFIPVCCIAVVLGQTTSPVTSYNFLHNPFLTLFPFTNCTVKSNTSCDECLKIVSCLWCISSQRCIDYPVKNILPPHSVCPLSDARWGMCWVNFQALIVSISVIAVVIIIAILVCCFRCCKCENIGSRRTDERMERQAQLRKYHHEERKTEMRHRHDEIRLKYGLAKDNPYSRFENN